MYFVCAYLIIAIGAYFPIANKSKTPALGWLINFCTDAVFALFWPVLIIMKFFTWLLES